MRLGGSKNKKTFKMAIKELFGINNYLELLTARLISPRLNLDAGQAKTLGSKILEDLSKISDEKTLYSVCNQLASVRFGEQFNIPVDFNRIHVEDESIVSVEDLDLFTNNKFNNPLPYGVIAILGGPDSGKTSLARYMYDRLNYSVWLSAMEPILDPATPYLIGPSASCLALVGSLYLKYKHIFFDSARFVRGVSDYGLGEKGLPIGVSLFLTDINNMMVSAKKRLFLIVSTESNNDMYNQAYYELLRGAVNGVIQPMPGHQGGFIEYKPSDRIATSFEYGDGDKFEASSSIFELKTNFNLKDLDNE